MKIIKTAELIGVTLDWAVAKCEGVPEYILNKPYRASELLKEYSIDWALGGPIIDREKFTRIVLNVSNNYTVSKKLVTLTDEGEEVRWAHGVGLTPLIASMRCYVASKLGNEIEIPKELINNV